MCISQLYYLKHHISVGFYDVNLMFSIAGQFLLEESRLIEAAEMAKKAAELDNTEFDVVFNAAHMLRLVCLNLTRFSLLFWRKNFLQSLLV